MTAESEGQAVRFAWGIGLSALALVIGSLVLLVLDWKAIDSAGTAQLAYFVQAPVVGVFGVLIAARRPRNPIGWLLLAIASLDAVCLLADFIAMRGLLSGASPHSWVAWPALVFNATGLAGPILLGFLVLFFPDGHCLVAAGGGSPGSSSLGIAKYTCTRASSPQHPSTPRRLSGAVAERQDGRARWAQT